VTSAATRDFSEEISIAGETRSSRSRSRNEQDSRDESHESYRIDIYIRGLEFSFDSWTAADHSQKQAERTDIATHRSYPYENFLSRGPCVKRVRWWEREEKWGKEAAGARKTDCVIQRVRTKWINE